jgi:tetratricopeptide (TPR) repeat protein
MLCGPGRSAVGGRGRVSGHLPTGAGPNRPRWVQDKRPRSSPPPLSSCLSASTRGNRTRAHGSGRQLGKPSEPARLYDEFDEDEAQSEPAPPVQAGPGAAARLRHVESCVAERLRRAGDATGASRLGEAEEALRSCALLVAARHGDHWAWYVHCWHAAVAAGGQDQSTRLCVKLREDAGRYAPARHDGGAIDDARLRREVRGVHLLLVAEFLGHAAREPAQALRLLDALAAGDSGGPLPQRLETAEAVARAGLLEQLGQLEAAMAVLLRGLERCGWAAEKAGTAAAVGYGEEEKYVAGYVETSRVAGLGRLGEVSLAASDLLLSRRCFAAYLAALSDLGGPRLELVRGRALWGMAQLCHREVRVGEAAAYAAEALVKLERQLLPDDALVLAVRAFVASAQAALGPAVSRKRDSGAGPAGDEDDSDMAPLPGPEEVPGLMRQFRQHYDLSEMVWAHRLARAALMVITETTSAAEALTRVAPHDRHPHVAAALQNLSWVCRQRGLYRQAGDAARACVEHYERRGVAAHHLDMVECQTELALLLVEQARYLSPHTPHSL